MSLNPLTLGERIVMAARIAAAEHIRQAVTGAGVDAERIEQLLRGSSLVPGTFSSSKAITADNDTQEAA